MQVNNETNGIISDLESLNVGPVIVGDLPEQLVTVVVRTGDNFVDDLFDPIVSRFSQFLYKNVLFQMNGFLS